MRMVTKKVEVQSVILKPDNLSFEDLILSKYLNRPYTRTGKTVQLKYVEDKGDYVIGLMVTTKKTGIPPKHDTVTDEFSPLDLNENEGLGYANVFIYDKSLQILMYEFNINGTYLSGFSEYITAFCQNTKEHGSFSIEFEPILNLQAYERMMKMQFYKSMEIKIAQPTELIDEYKGKNEAVRNTLKLGRDSHTDYLTLKLNVAGRRKEGLLNNFIQGFVGQFMGIGTKPDEEDLIKKIEVKGYEIDQDGENVPSTVDLILDRYKAEIKLEEKRVSETIQTTERKHAITDLYENSYSEFKKIKRLQNKRNSKSKKS